MKPKDFLSPEENAAYDTILAGVTYRNEGKILRDALIESRKTLKEVFDKLKVAMEVFK